MCAGDTSTIRLPSIGEWKSIIASGMFGDDGGEIARCGAGWIM